MIERYRRFSQTKGVKGTVVDLSCLFSQLVEGFVEVPAIVPIISSMFRMTFIYTWQWSSMLEAIFFHSWIKLDTSLKNLQLDSTQQRQDIRVRFYTAAVGYQGQILHSRGRISWLDSTQQRLDIRVRFYTAEVEYQGQILHSRGRISGLDSTQQRQDIRVLFFTGEVG